MGTESNLDLHQKGLVEKMFSSRAKVLMDTMDKGSGISARDGERVDED